MSKTFFILVIVGIFSILIGDLFYESFAETESLNVSKSSDRSYLPQLSVNDQGQVFVIYSEQRDGRADVFFTKKNTKENIFEIPVNLSDNPGGSHFPRFAITDDYVFSTWYDYSPCKSDVFFSKIDQDTKKFETVNLSSSAGVSYNPWIAASGNNVYVVWNDSTFSDGSTPMIEAECMDGYDSTTHMDIIFAKSSDKANSFDTINLSQTTFAWNPRITILEDNVYIVWNQKTSSQLSDIFFTKSSDGGKTFVEPLDVSDSARPSLEAGIQVSGNNVYVIWQESTSQEFSDIYFSKSINSGQSFSKPVNLSQSSSKSLLTRDTQMAVHENEIFIIWYDDTLGKNGVYFTQSSDFGETFSPPVNLSPNREKTGYAQVVRNDQDIFVMWHEEMDGNFEVLYRKSNDGGKTFGTPINLSTSESSSTLSVLGPQITLKDDSVYAIWEEGPKDSSDLFFQSFKTSLDPFFSLQTINGKVNVDLDIDKKTLDLTQPITFSLKFSDVKTQKILENVNYSFIIKDSNENTVFSEMNQFAQKGIASHTVTFSQTGPLSLIVNIEGTGTGSFLDTTNSGVVSVVITVVPEFPFVFGIFALIMTATLLIIKFKSHPLVSASNF